MLSRLRSAPQSSAPSPHSAGSARRGRRAAGAVVVGLSAAVLSACGPGPVQVEAAQDAANPDCAPAMLAMPEELGDQQLRQTASQGTAAYGDPASAIIRCGVTPPEPTTDLCTRVDGVDWLIRELDGDNQWQATTYGRDPAFEITFDTTVMPSSTALVNIGSAVSSVPQTAQCLAVEDAPSAD